MGYTRIVEIVGEEVTGMNKIYAVDLGKTEYLEVLKIQEKLEKKVVARGEVGYLLISETDPVITTGRSSDEDEILYTEERLRSMEIKKYPVERGGRVTLHGPGQIIGYLIINLENYKKDLHWYLSSVEDVIGGALDELEIESYKSKGRTGVWTRRGKVCAIGVKVRRWVTSHGFALNHTIDLDLFKAINPCGLMEYGVSKIDDYRQGIERKVVVEAVYRSFQKSFECELIKTEVNNLL